VTCDRTGPRLLTARTAGPLILLLAFVTATAFLSAAIISVFVILLPVALLSFAFGARNESDRLRSLDSLIKRFGCAVPAQKTKIGPVAKGCRGKASSSCKIEMVARTGDNA